MVLITQLVCVTIRWSNNYSEKIRVECGTKQGGLTSPVLFNLFYADLVNKLQSSDSGVTTNSATATNCVSLFDLRGIH